ncbi:SsrA-binding protein [Kribbella sp. NBC_01245]|uniref:hypothetical protein n=1 Tax=Kribbella sp. NBC_01245 TaxID=2903578 RepID=UPI002E2D5BF6|nr:hypothetical protein [Kribbella sp. NBC_01245]
MKKPEADPVIARNRKAAHDYQLGESWEAGMPGRPERPERADRAGGGSRLSPRPGLFP